MLAVEMEVSIVTRPATASATGRRERATSPGWRITCGVMTLAAVGLVVAVFLGAPLVSILLAGLLLLCPLLLWAPFRFQNRSIGALPQGRPPR